MERNTCQFHGCSRPQGEGHYRKGWGFCKEHQAEYDYLMHYADNFDMTKVDDFWRRQRGEPEET